MMKANRLKRVQWGLLATALLLAATGCSGRNSGGEVTNGQSPVSTTPNADSLPAGAGPPTVELLRNVRWTGDLDGMISHRIIRALVIHSKTFYFYDRGEARGIAAEALRECEKFVNAKLKTGKFPVHIVFIPVRRDDLIPALVEGRGDIAVANLTITPERQKLVDFSDPVYSDVNEIIVAGPTAPPLRMLEDLAGKEVYVRASSSYHESLLRLNVQLQNAGKSPVVLRAADENLEDEDILEMLDAGLVGISVIDSHKGPFWAKIFTDVTFYPQLAVSTGNHIGWAVRKSAPEFRSIVNQFVEGHKKGTAFGNTLLRKYFEDTDWVKNSASEEELKKFRAMAAFYRKYADKYRFDWLMTAAMGYQEPRLTQNLRSPAGAVGVMQIKPTTAAGDPINIRDVTRLENNIHAGMKYLRHISDEFLVDQRLDPINKGLFAFASYNAGPNKISRLRQKAKEEGLDPNKWFNNVELVVAREIGRETVQYVSNIYKYYLAYKMVVERNQARQAAFASQGADAAK